jgi:hypothetical protein
VEKEDKLRKFFETAKYVIFEVFLLASALLGVSLLLIFEWSRLLEFARLLGF